MSNTLNQYPVFENNQVLTSSQLNELAAYLDQQTRLTRVRAIGIGALCGLVPTVTTSSIGRSFAHVLISAGTGITSEGYLMNIGDCEMVQYRTYTLPTTFQYNPFIDPSTNAQVPLYELLPSTFVLPPGDPNVPAPIPPGFLTDKVLLFFLESVDVDNANCLGSNCATTGFERTLTLRKLMVSITDAQIIIANTGSFDLTYTKKFDLPDLRVQRALFDPSNINSSDYIAFSKQYQKAVSNVYTQNVISNPLDIIKVFQQVYTIFQPIVGDMFGNVNPFDPSQLPNIPIWNKIVNGVNDPTVGPSFLGIQYFYDFIKDLILAYDEFRDAAFDLMSDCCFDMGLFPQHLFLGELIPVDNCKPSQYRDYFVSVPVTGDESVAKQRVIDYFVRMVLMMRKFDVVRTHNILPLPVTLQTRITPSIEKMEPLSKRSIPYYYKLNETDTQLNTTLDAVWNFESIRRCDKISGQFLDVAYDNQSASATTSIVPIDPVQTPLLYDIDKYNFYRIEGAIRKDKDLVLNDLNTQKALFDLPFNVVAVRLKGTASRTDILAQCSFNDLRTDYTAYKNELICKLKKFGKFMQNFQTTMQFRDQPSSFIQLLDASAENDISGNSSVVFLPTVFSPMGLPPLAFRPPLVYAPRRISDVRNDILAHLTQLATRLTSVVNTLLPTLIDTFDFGDDQPNINLSFIKTYLDAVLQASFVKAYLNEYLDHIWHSTKTRFTQELYFTLSQWSSEVFYMLNEFILDCEVQNLQAVYYELERRIGYMQTNDPGLFSNFIKTNPGVDHKAGVAPGGTFVLVYPGVDLNFSVKNRNTIAALFQSKKNNVVLQASLNALAGRTAEQDAQLAAVNDLICQQDGIIAASTAPHFIDLGTVAIPTLQSISIHATDVIADFALPYLTNCNCVCTDIPPATADDLKFPTIAFPTFYQYNLGDFAFATDSIASTYGCSALTPINIDVTKSIIFAGADKGSESYVRLRFVTGGSTANLPIDVNPAVARSVNQTIKTGKGGTVSIIDGNGLTQQFNYIPPAAYTGLDSFNYAFEIYDASSNVKVRSNMASVIISITTKCPVSVVQPISQATSAVNNTAGIA